MHTRTESMIVFVAFLFLKRSAAQAWGNDGYHVDESAPSQICPSLFADFKRRQLAGFYPDAFVYNETVGGMHVPYLEITLGSMAPYVLTASVVVGDGDKEGGSYHPMVASDAADDVHFVTHIIVTNQDGYVVALKSMDVAGPVPASMTFEVPSGATELTPYEWCNLHGLWKGATVAVPTGTVVERNDCSVSDFPVESWTSVHSDFLRLQSIEFGSSIPFTEATGGERHTPYITLEDDGMASVLVGKTGGEIHPMIASDDPELVHWITEIYVLQNGEQIISMSSLDPSGVNEAIMDFAIPDGSETIQAFAWCNIHGLWEGPVVNLSSASVVAGSFSIESVIALLSVILSMYALI